MREVGRPEPSQAPRRLPRRWTLVRGPIAASGAALERARAVSAMLCEPAGVLPQKEGDPIRPFREGLREELEKRLKPDTPVKDLVKALAAYVRAKNYLFALAQPDSLRHDIDGAPVGPVSEEARMAAQVQFLALQEKWRESNRRRLLQELAIQKKQSAKAAKVTNTRRGDNRSGTTIAEPILPPRPRRPILSLPRREQSS